MALAALSAAAGPLAPLGPEPPVPSFSVAYMDRAVSPKVDFYGYANGQWLKDHPIPADRADWDGTTELEVRNAYLVHALVEEAAALPAPRGSARQLVGDFYRSAMDTKHLEELRLKPIAADLKRIDHLRSRQDLFGLLARFHNQGVAGLFHTTVDADPRPTSVYALLLMSEELPLPTPAHYLEEAFAGLRQAYRQYVARMLSSLGLPASAAAAQAAMVLELETALAKAQVAPEEKQEAGESVPELTPAELAAKLPALAWRVYFSERGLGRVPHVIVVQPQFFAALDQLVRSRPLWEWQVYLRWRLLDASGRYLWDEIGQAQFEFYGQALHGVPQRAPRWERALTVLDTHVGEAMGQLFVARHTTPQTKARLNELIEDLKAALAQRLQQADWMTETTRARALAQFDRFSYRIGYPDTFREYPKLRIRRDDYLGNVRRAQVLENRRQAARVGRPLDPNEWSRTLLTFDARFAASQNAIIVPAGLLRPPLFDLDQDDAVNYGALGTLIAHEMMHGCELRPTQCDATGNPQRWWTQEEEQKLAARVQPLVEQYNAYEVLPGLAVDGRKSLRENVADLGSVRIAYDALQRALVREPSKRKRIDGFTPEQRFFISFAQALRAQVTEAELRRLRADEEYASHAPRRFRAVGPLAHFQEFFDAFDIRPGDPMWRAPERRVHLW